MKNIFKLFIALIMVVSVSACGSSSSDSADDTTPANNDPAYFGKWVITHSCSSRGFSDAGCGAIESNGWVYTFSDGQIKYTGVSDDCNAVFNASAVGDNPWTITRTVVSQNENCSWTVGDVKQFTLEVEDDGSQMKWIEDGGTPIYLLKPDTSS